MFKRVLILSVKAFGVLEKLSDRCLVQKRMAQHSENVKGASFKMAIMFDDSNETIGDYCRVELDSNSIFGVAPERLNSKMLLYPFEKQLNLPSFFIEQGYVLSFEFKVVSQKGESPLKLRSIVDNSSEVCGLSNQAKISRRPQKNCLLCS